MNFGFFLNSSFFKLFFEKNWNSQCEPEESNCGLNSVVHNLDRKCSFGPEWPKTSARDWGPNEHFLHLSFRPFEFSAFRASAFRNSAFCYQIILVDIFTVDFSIYRDVTEWIVNSPPPCHALSRSTDPSLPLGAWRYLWTIPFLTRYFTQTKTNLHQVFGI
jgi:hypothetical protein